MTVKSLELYEKDATVNAPSATTGAMDEEVDVAEDVRTTVGPTRSGATNLARIVGRTSLVRAHGGTSLARIALRAMLAFLRYRHRQEGTTTTIRTRGLGASRNRVQSPASWAELKPQPFSASSSSSPAK